MDGRTRLVPWTQKWLLLMLFFCIVVASAFTKGGEYYFVKMTAIRGKKLLLKVIFIIHLLLTCYSSSSSPCSQVLVCSKNYPVTIIKLIGDKRQKLMSIPCDWKWSINCKMVQVLLLLPLRLLLTIKPTTLLQERRGLCCTRRWLAIIRITRSFRRLQVIYILVIMML